MSACHLPAPRPSLFQVTQGGQEHRDHPVDQLAPGCLPPLLLPGEKRKNLDWHQQSTDLSLAMVLSLRGGFGVAWRTLKDVSLWGIRTQTAQ